MLVNSWILNTIKLGLRLSVNYSERVDELWANLKERFLVGNGPRKYELKAALANCKQRRDMVNAYYICSQKIWDELQYYMLYQCPTLLLLSSKKERKSKFTSS